ncbi:hypothetical protein MRX96_034546 [Rhipicephalus microplus]
MYWIKWKNKQGIYRKCGAILPAGRTRRLSLDLEDGENPAEYTASINGKSVVWVTMLGTDYHNWALVHIREGNYVSTALAARKPSFDPEFEKRCPISAGHEPASR